MINFSNTSATEAGIEWMEVLHTVSVSVPLSEPDRVEKVNVKREF